MESVYFESCLAGKWVRHLPVEYDIVKENRPGIFAPAHWQNTAEIIYVKKRRLQDYCGRRFSDVKGGRSCTDSSQADTHYNLPGITGNRVNRTEI